MLPGSDASVEFISRPRHIALCEFGPKNVIYHKGQKFEITQLFGDAPGNRFENAVVSTKPDYFLRGEDVKLDRYSFSGEDLVALNQIKQQRGTGQPAAPGLCYWLYVVVNTGIESHLLVPLIQRHAVNLPPAVAVFLMGELFGFFGVLLAIPLAATLLVLVKMVYVRDALGD